MITKTVNGPQRDPIFLGRRGENLATQICFDVPEDLSSYAYTLYVRRPRERESYPAAHIARVGNTIVWTVSNVDTENSGEGQVQIRFTDNDVVVKTIVYRTVVGIAIDINTSPAPEWQESWLDALTELAEETHTNAENAAESERKAKISEDNAKDSEEAADESAQQAHTSEQNAKDYEDAADASAEDAEAWAVGQRNGVDVPSSDETYHNNSKHWSELAQQGAQEAGYVFFDVNDEDGEMYVEITDNVDQDVSFEVNTTIGELEVTVA